MSLRGHNNFGRSELFWNVSGTNKTQVKIRIHLKLSLTTITEQGELLRNKKNV